MKMKKQYEASHQLILGENDKKNNVYIQERNRMKHLLVVGTKGTGKSTGVLPALAKQDFEDKRAGATIVVGEKDTALLLFALAKRASRDVVLIKPSLTDAGKMLLLQTTYRYDNVINDVVDYEKAITKRQIVIIDMEFARHQEKAIKGVAYLMAALHEAVVKTNEHTPTKHFLYVDDVHLYLPFLKNILHSGKEYGVGCTLFLESRLQLATAEEKALVGAYVRNTVLMSELTLEDAQYYVEDIYEKQIPFMRNRPLKEFIYSTTDREGKRTAGTGKFIFLADELIQSLRMAIPRYRGGIERDQVGVVTPIPLKDEPTFSEPKRAAVELAPVPRPFVTSEPKPANVHVKSVPVGKAVETQMRRHVIVLDDVFDDDDEY